MNDEKEIGQVNVVGDRYKFDGKFHHIEKNQPIYDQDSKLRGVTNPRNMTYVHTYGGEAIFFESLGKGILLGSRCDNPDCESQGSIFIPFRIHCPDCLFKNSPVDISDKAKKEAMVHTFMITERTGAFNTLPKPVKFVNVEFQGVSTILMGPLAVGEPKIGMRVIPIFKKKDPTFTILDIQWVPEGTEEGSLPEGYEF